MTEKICSECGQTKETSEFSKSNLSKDGYELKCKACKQIKKPIPDKSVKKEETELCHNIVTPWNNSQQPETSQSEYKTGKYTLTIDLTDYQELYHGLLLHSKSQFRTPELQAAYMITSLLKDLMPNLDDNLNLPY